MRNEAFVVPRILHARDERNQSTFKLVNQLGTRDKQQSKTFSADRKTDILVLVLR